MYRPTSVHQPPVVPHCLSLLQSLSLAESAFLLQSPSPLRSQSSLQSLIFNTWWQASEWWISAFSFSSEEISQAILLPCSEALRQCLPFTNFPSPDLYLHKFNNLIISFKRDSILFTTVQTLLNVPVGLLWPFQLKLTFLFVWQSKTDRLQVCTV